MNATDRLTGTATSTWNEFRAFLIKQNVLSLAIAVVIGTALNDFVKSLVDGAIMPIVAAVTPAQERYEQLTWTVGGIETRPGLILAALVNFLVIGLVAWRLTKLFITPPKPGPTAATRSCPHCWASIDARATRCQHCTSEVTPSAGG